MIDRTVDRFCRDYPTAAPSVLVPRVEQRLRFLVKLLDGKVTLGQHRHLLVAGGWLATLLACLQFDLGDREAAEASQSAAYTFAREAEHQELLAWTYELLAWALVDRRYDEVIEYSRTGLEIAPNTSAGIQLAVQQAKGWSRLGDAPRADESLRMAGTVLAAPWHDGSRAVSLAGVLAALGAAACYAGSYVYARLLLTNRGIEPLVLAAAQLTLGTILLSAAVPWIGRQPMTLSSTVVLSVVALGVLSTGVAYVLNYRLIQDEGPTAASMTNYLTPVVAVLLGIAFVGEQLTWNLVIGTAMILVGLWIAEHNSGERELASNMLSSQRLRARGRERI